MDNSTHLSVTQTQTLTAGFAALAICIHLFESSLPSVLGIKPGLSNIITLIVLLRYGLSMAVNVQLLRVFIASLLNGSIFTPTFFLSLSGALSALCGLALVYFFMSFVLQQKPDYSAPAHSPLRPSVITYSVIAAMANMLGQFMLAYVWLIPHTGLFKLLPFLLLIALVFGWANGIISVLVLRQLENTANTTHYA